MKHSHDILCIHCSGLDLQKNGHSENGTQRWFCKQCRHSFQLSYRYNAHKPGVKEQIIVLTLNGSGVRDTGRILGINKNTVVRLLQNGNMHECPIYQGLMEGKSEKTVKVGKKE